MNKDTAQSIIKKVKADYNLIAEHFSQTRYQEWYEFHDFSQYLSEGAKILDLGCGNGRLLHFLASKNIDYVGLDISENLIKIANQLAQKKKESEKDFPYFSFSCGDLTSLPFENQSFDAVFAIASLYHVPSRELRRKALEEISRVLKKNGIFIMSYWNMWVPSRVKLIIKNIIKKMVGKSQLDFFDAEKLWKNSKGETITKRYCHAFTLREITALLKKQGLVIKKRFYTKKGKKAYFWNGSNGIVIAKKGM